MSSNSDSRPHGSVDFRSQVEPEEKAASTTTPSFKNAGQPAAIQSTGLQRNVGEARSQVSLKERGWKQKHRREKAKAWTSRREEEQRKRAGQGRGGSKWHPK